MTGLRFPVERCWQRVLKLAFNLAVYHLLLKSPETPQVASHAQKYFIRLNSMNKKDKRRSSIHDITSPGGNTGEVTGNASGRPSRTGEGFQLDLETTLF